MSLPRQCGVNLSGLFLLHLLRKARLHVINMHHGFVVLCRLIGETL